MRASGIRRIAVIGAGLMGHGIALEFAAHGYDIRLHDRDPAQLAWARGSIAEGLRRLVEIGRITPATAAATPDRITLSTDLRSIGGDRAVTFLVLQHGEYDYVPQS
jgi:3-hydroxyacyl-CoA dehydrogenase